MGGTGSGRKPKAVASAATPSSLPPRKLPTEAPEGAAPAAVEGEKRLGRPPGKKGLRADGLKSLPEKPEDFDKLLAPYRVMVRPLVSGVSKICEVADSLPLDADEKEGGVQAFSALLYQYGGELDARVLVGMWIAGVTLPRVLHYLKKEREASEEKKRLREDPPKLVRVEKEINAPPR